MAGLRTVTLENGSQMVGAKNPLIWSVSEYRTVDSLWKPLENRLGFANGLEIVGVEIPLN